MTNQPVDSKTRFPTVDLSLNRDSDQRRHALAVDIREICHRVGFFVLKNHGVERKLVDAAFDQSKLFFALHAEQKQLIDKLNSPCFRGWEGEGAELTNNRPDIREQIDIWTEHKPSDVSGGPHYMRLLGPNQWLPEKILPGFKENITRYFDAMTRLGDELMGLLGLGLGLPPDYFANCFGERRMSLLKLINYPPTPDGEFGVNPHHDSGFLTILNPGYVPGLEIEMEDGSWVPVPVIEDSFVINLGEMLQAMTGNYFIATPHRVATSAPRMSIGYFHGPALETSISRLPLPEEFNQAVSESPRHRNAGFMAPINETETGVAAMQGSLKASTYGDQLWTTFAAVTRRMCASITRTWYLESGFFNRQLSGSF